MKTAFQIFRRDVRRLLKNRAATLVMIGVCLLPSLYAWFNIAANMDPYANTSGIRVAIANCDTGTKTDVITMNAGDSIVEKLKENKSLGWQFVSEEKAKEGVQAGDYYAAIVIPENFSSSLVSILWSPSSATNWKTSPAPLPPRRQTAPAMTRRWAVCPCSPRLRRTRPAPSCPRRSCRSPKNPASP